MMIYIVPFKFDGSRYLRGLELLARNWLLSRGVDSHNAVEVLQKRSLKKLLVAQFRSKVIIEDIHTAALYLWLRPDLIVYHYPRGGCTLKVGWKTTGQLSVTMWLKLIRRNRIYLNSRVFCDYLAKEELTPRARYIDSLEPVTLVDDASSTFATAKRLICIALSEDRCEDDYMNIAKKLKSANDDVEIAVSVHPQSGFQIDSLYTTEILNPDIQVLITDCVSSAYYYFVRKKRVIVVEEAQSHQRRLFEKQNYFFKNIAKIDDVGNYLANENYSSSLITLSDRPPTFGWS